MTYTRLAVILGNMLFENHTPLKPDENTLYFMAEENSLAAHYKYHKHKIAFFFTAMREHAKTLEPIVYHKLSKKSYEELLEDTITTYSIKEIITYTIEDKFFKKRIEEFTKKHNITLTIVPSQAFLNDDFKEDKLFFHNYYIKQRKKHQVLVEDNKPLYGQWSFDHENRKKLPKTITPPKLPNITPPRSFDEVKEVVNTQFSDHPGGLETFYLPTTRAQALEWFNTFIEERFEQFGPYEDAIEEKETFLFHSLLSPLLNIGLLTPKEVIDRVVKTPTQNFASKEGFIRQVLGWREFIRGVYQTRELGKKNFFNHTNKLNENWYKATTGIVPLDNAISKAQKYAYTHHIERLMVIGNIMLLARIDPNEVNKWFMEMYVDSSDWVMEPNVYGMSQFSEGPLFATKPYIGGSNYILKMSHYKKDEWCEVLDGLYWLFIHDNREFFSRQPRLSMMVKLLDKQDSEKLERIFQKARTFIYENTL